MAIVKTDREIFASLGIKDEDTIFNFVELVGNYKVSFSEKTIYEVKKNKRYIVRGAYEHILEGVWHIKWTIGKKNE